MAHSYPGPTYMRCIECGFIADAAAALTTGYCTYCGSTRFTLDYPLPPVVDYRKDMS